MAAPTFVAEYESVWNTTTTPKTASVTVANGDVLVISGMAELNTSISTPTGGGLTYTLRQSIAITDYCTVYVYTAVATSSQTFTLSVGRGATSAWYGFNCLRFSGSGGIGASSKTNVASGAPSLALTTTGASSAIVTANGDWNGGDGTSRTWRTINSLTPTSGNGLERTYFRDAAHYAVYVAYWTNVGAAGAKTTGLSAPTGQKYAIVSVEILGGAAGDAAIANNIVIASTGARDSAGAAAIANNVVVAGTGTRKSQGVAAIAINLAIAGTGVADRQGVASFANTINATTEGVADSVGTAGFALNVALNSEGDAPTSAATGQAAFAVNVGVSAAGLSKSVGAAAFSMDTLLETNGVSRRQGVVSISVNTLLSGAGARESQGAAGISLNTLLDGSGAALSAGIAQFSLIMTLNASTPDTGEVLTADLLTLKANHIVTLNAPPPIALKAYYLVVLEAEDLSLLESEPELELTWTH